jgi:hypothetical protein
MAALATGAQLVEDARVNPCLRINETIQIEGNACGFHVAYRDTVVKKADAEGR